MKTLLINLALGIVSTMIQALGLPSLREFAIAFVKAFGPNGARHFSELPLSEQVELLRRVPVLRTNHEDWPKAFKWVPRTLTCFVMPSDKAPEIIYGNGTVEDIPEPGTYVATRGYVAVTTNTKFHARFGWRWDRNDHYLEFPSITAKQLG